MGEHRIGSLCCAVFEEGFWLSEIAEEVTPTNVDGVSVEFGACIWINNVYVDGDYSFSKSSKESSKSIHVWLQYIPLPVEMKAEVDDMCWLWLPPYTCQVQFYCRDYRESRAFRLKSCGVHLVCQQDSNDVTVAVNDTDLAGAAVYQNTCQQYLAAKELKNQHWAYHRKYNTWFQRNGEPKVSTDEYEQGTYRYFDFHIDNDDLRRWCENISAKFTSEYNYLADELIV